MEQRGKFSPKTSSFSINSLLGNKHDDQEQRSDKPTLLETVRDRSVVGRERQDIPFLLNGESKRVAIARNGIAHSNLLLSHYGPVRVTLENKSLWDVFHKVGTEMVITKSGRYVLMFF